jgi:hypothetical protein
MPGPAGSLKRRAVLTACLLVIAATTSAQPHSSAPGLLTRYDFHLSASALGSGDVHFQWDTHLGGDLDVADYGFGRIWAAVDYEALLGSELSPFDPQQAYYALQAASSYRAGPVELAVLFHHVSRHLSDHDKAFPIAWNVVGGRADGVIELNGLTIEAHGDAGAVTEHAYVDYRWTATGDVRIRRPLGTRAEVFVHGIGDAYGVDPSLAGRSTQLGGLIEGGVRFVGRAAVAELFVGYESRVDANPVTRESKRWALGGFRLVNR